MSSPRFFSQSRKKWPTRFNEPNCQRCLDTRAGTGN